MGIQLKTMLSSFILFGPTIYIWTRLITSYLSMKRQLKDAQLFYAKHNCVVTYSRKCIRGWPPEIVNINRNNLNQLLDPYLYFINTAESRLDLAVMVVSLIELVESICAASLRGVKVRLMVNFQSVKNKSKLYNEIKNAGVEIGFYVPKTENMNHIMHFKYMLKDWDKDGFVCMGSMNYTGLSSILNNFEDMVFTSHPLLVMQFKKNFEDSWNMITKDNENVFNKTCLADAGFL